MRTFHPVYNPKLAVRALAGIRLKFPEAKMVMGGADRLHYREEVQNYAKELGIFESIEFPGFLDLKQKIYEGSRADIFINTTRTDNMPVSIVEAAALGLPIVATSVGGIPDLLTHDENALLIRDDSVEELISSVIRLLNDSQLTSKISIAARRLAERSDWSVLRTKWEQLFLHLEPKH